jgi:surface-anchored protein
MNDDPLSVTENPIHTMNTNSLRPLLAATSLAFIPASAFAQVELPADHVDLGIGYDAGALELHWHDEEGGVEYAPDEAYAFIPLLSSIPRPAGAQWDFTGAIEGGAIYVAPETSTGGVIFLGLGSEEIADGTFVANTVTFRLDSVSGPGGGVFALWQTDFLGQPLVALSSTSGGQTSFNVITGGHGHYNWGFTTPGIYELTFTVSGTLVGETLPISDTATYTFAVGTAIPEPSTYAALVGLAVLGFAASRRRRA